MWQWISTRRLTSRRELRENTDKYQTYVKGHGHGEERYDVRTAQCQRRGVSSRDKNGIACLLFTETYSTLTMLVVLKSCVLVPSTRRATAVASARSARRRNNCGAAISPPKDYKKRTLEKAARR